MILVSVLSLWASCQPVACINLNARLRGVELHHAARAFVRKFCCKVELVFAEPVDDPATVVAFPVDEVRKFFLNVLANQFAFGEIHGCSNDRSHFASGNQFIGCGQETVGIEAQLVVEDVAVTFSL